MQAMSGSTLGHIRSFTIQRLNGFPSSGIIMNFQCIGSGFASYQAWVVSLCAWGTTTLEASFGSEGTSHRKSSVAAIAPANCATMKPGTSAGLMPANVSDAARARVTAGFANEVEEVNQ